MTEVFTMLDCILVFNEKETVLRLYRKKSRNRNTVTVAKT